MEIKLTIFTDENCPRCKILKQRLKDNNLNYDIGDIQEIVEKGYSTIPILKVNDRYLQFGESIEWIKSIPKLNIE